jgi:hypothetical protein
MMDKIRKSRRSDRGWSGRLMLTGLLLLLVACGENTVPAQNSAPAGDMLMTRAAMSVAPADFSGLAQGWNEIAPGGDTVCSDGTPYRFHVYQGDPAKVLFYLEGGGACWDSMNCDPDLRPSYTVNLNGINPAGSHGILAMEHPENPFRDYTVVYAPYCSGDVHLGDSERHYTTASFNGHEAHELHIRHRGWINGSAALDWLYAHVFTPEQIFVTGSSAGSIPSPFYAVKIAAQYPNATVVQLGDGSGGYRGFANFSPYDVWHVDRVVSDLNHIATIPADQFSFHHLYLAAARENSRIRFASYDNAEDDVQKQFLALGGTPTESLRPLLEQNLREIGAELDAFHYYVAGGTMHTILRRPEVYSYEVNGVRFVDWIAGLARNEPVANVMCSDCSSAPGE